MTTPDFKFQNEGTLFLVRPLNDEAHDWLDERTDGMWFGGALVVEHRYARDLAEGMLTEGWEVE